MTSVPDKALDDLLRFDGLHAAEQVTGDSYKDDPATIALGLALTLGGNDRKAAALKAAADTYFSMPFSEHLDVYGRLGFDIVLDELFQGTDDVTERFVVLWQPAGVLASCESYARIGSTNSSWIHYNWRPDQPDNADAWWQAVSSGGTRPDGVWVGDHDAREGLAHKFASLEAKGRFLSPWPHAHSYPHLLTYAESREAGWDRDRYSTLRRERVERLPSRVREAIGAVDA